MFLSKSVLVCAEMEGCRKKFAGCEMSSLGHVLQEKESNLTEVSSGGNLAGG